MTIQRDTLATTQPLFAKPAVKAGSLLVLAFAAGITVFGLIRYSAKASELLPGISAARAFLSQSDRTDELYQFSMERVGTRLEYQLYEVEVVHAAGVAKIRLQLQKPGKGAAVKTYEQVVSETRFIEFWQALRKLETAQLTNLSPSTENLGQTSRQTASRTKRAPVTAETYRFKFQDGLEDYPNSFEVYAPEALEDSRYRQIRDLTEGFVKKTFGDSIEH